VRHRGWLAGALLVGVLVAGCAGGSGTTTTVEPTTASPATDAGSADGSTGTTVTTALESEDGDGDGGTAWDDVDASTVGDNAVDAIDGVDRYRTTGSVNQTVRTNAVTQNVSVETTGLVNRDDRRLHASLTQHAQGQSTDIERYILDGWIYERQDAYVQEYSSAWVKRNVTGNVTVPWRNTAELALVRAFLDNGSATAVNRTTLDGSDAYVLRVDANETALERYLVLEDSENFRLSNVSMVLWVDADTWRPLRAVRDLEKAQTTRGQTINFDLTTRATFTYEVDEAVTLPSAAQEATNLANATSAN